MLVPWLALAALALGASSLLRVRAARAFPLALGVVVGVLYVPALFGGLYAGVYAVYLLALAGLGCFIFLAVRRKNVPEGTFGALLVWLLFFVFALVQNRGRMLVNWDEFTHWGLTAKTMSVLNVLNTDPVSNATFRDYPPAMSLIQYFFARTYPAFREDATLIAMNAAYFALVMPVFSLTRKRHCLTAGTLFFLNALLLPTAFYPSFFSELYVDAMLGLLLGGALATYFSDDSLCGRFCVLSQLCLLALTKSSGAGLAAIALVVMAVDALRFSRGNRRAVFLTAGAVLIALLSWKAHTTLAGVGSSWTMDGLGRLAGLSGGRKNAVLYFLRALGEFELTGYLMPVTCFTALILFLCAGWALLRKRPLAEQRRMRMAFGMTAIGAALYAGTLLALYLFAYSEYEAENLASFGRYMMTYALAMLFFTAGIGCVQGVRRGGGVKAAVCVFLSLCVLQNVGLTLYHEATAPLQSRETANARESYAPARKAKRLMQEGERLYILSPVGGDYDWWLVRYDLGLPDDALNPSDWTSVGTAPYAEGDIWTRVMAPEDWASEVAAHYDYLYLCWTKEAFERDFAAFFPQGLTQQTLYRVTQENGTPVLLPIQ